MLIPLVAVVLAMGLAMLIHYFQHRRHEMSHRERMAAIEKNIQLPDSFFQEPVRSSRTYLLRGLVWLAVGIGLAAFFVTMGFAERTDPEIFAVATVGLIPAGVGLAYLFVYGKARAEEADKSTSSGSSPEASLRQ